MKGASEGQMIFCFLGGWHPSCTTQIVNLDENEGLQVVINKIFP
jgi:hypothetical protein